MRTKKLFENFVSYRYASDILAIVTVILSVGIAIGFMFLFHLV